MLRDVIIFLAGVEFFHTLTHIFYYFFVGLPLNLKVMTLTPAMNTWAIVINAIITILLLVWASRLRRSR